MELRTVSQNRTWSRQSWDTSYWDGVVLEIYLDHKFQWPQEGLNSKSFVYETACSFTIRLFIVYRSLNWARDYHYRSTFFARTDLEKNCPKRMKNFYLIKLVSKWKRKNRNEHASFFINLWRLILVRIDLEFNSEFESVTHFLQNCRRGIEKSSQT